MTCDIVQCLKTDVVRKQFIKNANRLNIVQKTLAAMLAEYDVSEEIALRDIDAFVAKLEGAGILV